MSLRASQLWHNDLNSSGLIAHRLTSVPSCPSAPLLLLQSFLTQSTSRPRKVVTCSFQKSCFVTYLSNLLFPDLNAALVDVFQLLTGSKYVGCLYADRLFARHVTPEHVSSLWNRMLKGAAGSVVQATLVALLRWPDSSVSRKCVNLCRISLTNAFECIELKGWVAQVFETVLELLVTSPPHVNNEEMALDMVSDAM